MHVRTLADDEALVTGGGLRAASLCGRDLAGGWDITEAARDEVLTLPSRTCSRCADTLR